MRALGRWLPPVLLVVALVAAWQIAASTGFLADTLGLESFLVPSPSEIADVMWQDRSLLADNAWVTFYEIVAGFLVALSDAHNQRDFRGRGFEDGVRGERRRDEDDRHIRARLADSLVDGREDWHAVLLFSTTLRVDGGDDVGPVGDRAAHVVRAFGPDALDHEAGISIDKHSHLAKSEGAISGFRFGERPRGRVRMPGERGYRGRRLVSGAKPQKRVVPLARDSPGPAPAAPVVLAPSTLGAASTRLPRSAGTRLGTSHAGRSHRDGSAR